MDSVDGNHLHSTQVCVCVCVTTAGALNRRMLTEKVGVFLTHSF